MEMELEILQADERFKGVVNVRVPGIYVTRGNPLPKRMSKLVKPAVLALQKVYKDIVAEGGHLYLSDMFRSANDQQKAHEDWKSGRKSAYSPPSCNSVHEAARAIDIDAFDTMISHKRVREILNRYGWINIVATLTGAECWHYEFRQKRWEDFKTKNGYAEMARAMKKDIGNVTSLAKANRQMEDMKWVQSSLNKILKIHLTIDGLMGEKTREAVRKLQKKYRLQADGIPGPITRKKMKEILGV
ncbi:hypothetical protein LCGC14_1368040 [marine sediment metagenome]|uniref:Peptidoglycan binding-like domain-containing protein n=1 Tax=marine sediment metagenome TaxID=412755 RepID=A0A0F9N858_9ZZZZ